MHQHTLRNTAVLKGTGLHTGKKSSVKICPAPAGTGIVFRRTDLCGRPEIRSSVEAISGVDYAMVLGSGIARVRSVEHFLSAFYAAGIQNVVVEVDAEEMPSLDGSAQRILKAIQVAGKRRQSRLLQDIQLKGPVYCIADTRAILAYPAKQLIISYYVEYENALIGHQHFTFKMGVNIFEKEIASARTFGWKEQITLQKKQGFIKGGSLQNALVFDAETLLNPGGLRFPDEPVRHKILDLVGALALLPGRLLAHIVAIKSGHVMDVEIVKKIFKIHN